MQPQTKANHALRRSGLVPLKVRHLRKLFGASPSSSTIGSDAIHSELESNCSRNDIESLGSTLDMGRWDSIPEYSKGDLLVSKHLGMGTFSDVFEVRTDQTLHTSKSSQRLLNETIVDSSEDSVLTRLLEAKFAHSANERKPSASVSIDSHPSSNPAASNNRQLTLAMKCIRPQTRSTAELFTVAIKDLIRETAMLSSLDHPSIIRLHGRGAMSFSDPIVQGKRYFILLDRLTDTLDQRMERWRGMSLNKNDTPSVVQLKTVYCIADALAYLHSKNIVYCDLKPQNG